MHNARTALTLALTLLACTACSGGGASVGEGPNGGVTPGGEDGGDQEPTPEDAGADGSSLSDARADAAGRDERINPIALGRSWTYDVTILGTYPICKPGSNTGQVLGQKVVDGKEAFQIQSFCPGAGVSSYAVDGDRVELYYANTWVLLHDSPVQDGHTWTDGFNSYAWEEVGELTVPAGTFSECWKAKHQGGASFTTFCRGIGPVRWHFVDQGGNGYDATLTAYGS
jgi:hypothetical protein